VSVGTGKRITYPVSYPRDRETGKVDRTAPLFVSVMTGPDNERSYSYLGFIRDRGNGLVYSYGNAKAKVAEDAPSARGFHWFWRCLFVNGEVPGTVEFWHEGKCGRCGRKLTVPSSIEAGFGP